MCVCVCNICIDVKLLFFPSVLSLLQPSFRNLIREPFLRLALWNQREPGSFLCLAHWKQSHSCVWLLGTKMNPGPFLCLALWNQNERRQGATLPVTREWPTKSLVSGTENVPALLSMSAGVRSLEATIYIYICT